MIQVLVVDDEIHCAEGVKCSIDWSAMGVDNVFTAYSMAQAQKVITQEEIHIIISDVEMPKGSGFDLLRWIAGSQYSPVVIMLTSYATFEYAKLAIEYQCLDYLLKPVNRDDLMDVVKRAVAAVIEERKKNENNQLAEYWNSDERNRVRHFWREIIERRSPMDSKAIAGLAREQHIVLDERNQYLPILYKIHDSESGMTWRNSAEDLKSRLYKYVFSDESQVVLVYSDWYMLAIAGYSGDFAAHFEQFRQGSRTFMDKVRNEFGLMVSAYMGEFMESGEVPTQYVRLLSMDKNNVAERQGIYLISQQIEKVIYSRPDIEKWMQDFSAGNYEQAFDGVAKYVDLQAHERRLNQESLTQLLQDFMQAFYIAVGEKELQAHLLFEDDTSVKLFRRATVSVKDFKAWIHHVIRKAAEYVDIASDTGSVVKHIKKFICSNLGEELSRMQIAAEVCMSPDYVSRVFRQETGIQLSEFITEMRMDEAKRLLKTTDLPVGEVAFKVGYYNIAYFSRVFRIRNGMTPAAYRTQNKEK